MANDINISVGVFAGDALRDLARVQNQVQSVGNKINSTTRVLNQHATAYNRTAVSTNKWANGALQQTGYQLGDFFVQVTNGTSAMQAFGQQGSQILGVFGPVGAILGAAVAIFAALGVAAERSGQEMSQFAVLLGSLQAPAEAVVSAFREIGISFGNVSKFLISNIDTMIIAAGLFAGKFLIVKAAVAAYAAITGMATTATIGLGVAVKAVGAALMRFLPIAIILTLAKVIEMFLRLKDGVGGFGNAFRLLGDMMREVMLRMVIGFEGLHWSWISMTTGFAIAWKKMLIEIQAGFADFLHKTARVIDQIPGMDQLYFKIGNAAIMAGANVYETKSQIDGLRSAMEFAAETASGAFKDMGAPLETMKPLMDGIAAGTKEIGNLNFGKAVEQTGALARALEPIKNKFDDLKSSIESSMENAFISMVDGTKSVKDAFRDMARMIIIELYRVLVVQQMVAAISSAFKLATFGMGGFRANGGPVNAGTPYIVGEKGPEIVVPGRSGVVVPNDKIGMGGGETIVINQTINVSTGVQQTVRSEIKQMMPMIADNAKAAVLDAKRRGGNYGRAFA